MRILENSGPIGLALMVLISEVDDSHTKFETVHQSHSFLDIFNKRNKSIQYTMGKEGRSQKLHFLDVTIINTGAGKYEFNIHRKNAIRNVQLK